MHTGLMYFDNDKSKSLTQKVQGAINYYIKKYGANPNLALVHPSMFEEISINGIEVRPYRPVLLGNIWIGIKDKD